MTLSNDGRYVIVSGGHDQPALTWRAVASGQDEIKHAFGAIEVGGAGGWMGRFDHQDFQWINVGVKSRPQWPWEHRLPWLTKWLPDQPKRTFFIVADQNSGTIIVQGAGHRPNVVSPDGRLLDMEDVDSGRELLRNIPFHAGLPWPVAAAAGLSLPAFSLLAASMAEAVGFVVGALDAVYVRPWNGTNQHFCSRHMALGAVYVRPWNGTNPNLVVATYRVSTPNDTRFAADAWRSDVSPAAEPV